MVDPAHLAILKQGVWGWNSWRKRNAEIKPDLHGADLTGMNLMQANLRHADLSGARLIGANLHKADLYKASLGSASLYHANLSHAEAGGSHFNLANLEGANLSDATLSHATLTRANLRGARLNRANLSQAILTRADLSGANLTEAKLVEAMLCSTNLTGANLTRCEVYGVAAWNTMLDGAKQEDIVITPWNEPTITVDNLEIAQFIYVLLHNDRIRSVIDTITTKAVLILGRFTNERKAVLDAIRQELRKYDFVPIVFDFDKPTERNFTETVTTLARMSKFIIADVTDPRSVPHELASIVPTLPSVPVQPIIQRGQEPFAMMIDLARYDWFLPCHTYQNLDELIVTLDANVIKPALASLKKSGKKAG